MEISSFTSPFRERKYEAVPRFLKNLHTCVYYDLKWNYISVMLIHTFFITVSFLPKFEIVFLPLRIWRADYCCTVAVRSRYATGVSSCLFFRSTYLSFHSRWSRRTDCTTNRRNKALPCLPLRLRVRGKIKCKHFWATLTNML